jgi:hypothetical protein
MWRKFLVAGSLALIGVLSWDAGQANEKNQGNNRGQQDRDGRDHVEEIDIVEVIRLRNDLRNKQVQIESVIVVTDRNVYGTLTEIGIERDSADKLQLGNLPIIGNLFSNKVPANLTSEQEVGRAYSNGTTLVITIWPTVADSSVRLEILPKEIDLINDALRSLKPANQPLASEMLTSGLAGGGPIESLLVINEASVFELPRTIFRDMGVIVDGQTVMIGGLTSQTEPQKSGTPMLSKLPIVGYLFQGKAYRQESELVVIVTPSIVEPAE